MRAPANGIRSAAIHCFAKEPRKSDDDSHPRFISLAFPCRKQVIYPLEIPKTDGAQPKLNAVCFAV